MLYRYSAFSDKPGGGNPAGVWIGATLPDPATMQRIAAEVGFSETAFLCPDRGHTRTVRYFSPEQEILFCGHATIAAGVVLGETEGEGTYHFRIRPGEIPVRVFRRDGRWEAAFTSVTPGHERMEPQRLDAYLATLGWTGADLDPALPPARAYAGAWHLVIAVRDAQRLAALGYDYDRLKALMLADDLTTLQIVWRERSDLFHSRNPFPVGGVIEDPATGAAAAALAGYLRDAALAPAPTSLVIRQGEAMGRPSTLFVEVPRAGGIVVSGNAVPMEHCDESDHESRPGRATGA